jgi:2-oxoisovalerate dehydrogenase E1 component
MLRPAGAPADDLHQRFATFVAEQDPFVADVALEALSAALSNLAAFDPSLPAHFERLRNRFGPELRRRLRDRLVSIPGETTPRVTAAARAESGIDDLTLRCDGFFRRAALRASLTADERREILGGMILTRATDNRLRTLFTGGEVRYGDTAFQGKGFRSLGQEAIYAAGIRLRRGEAYRQGPTWTGDVVAPVIRDLGVALSMRPTPETVRMVLSAQMGKAGPPMDGKDLHIGDFDWGILPAAAPLAIGTLTIAGMAMAFSRQRESRVALSFIGEGGSSLGEWHEAINLCAVRRLPAVFCVENNQTALSTPVSEQSAVRVFADKAIGYGIPGITIDGTDPDEIAAAFAWAVERARSGEGPSLIEVVAMRMCGHAHHDDMLYLGKDPAASWQYPTLSPDGYANAELYEYWSSRDPLGTYSRRLIDDGLVEAAEVNEWKDAASRLVDEQAQAVIDAPWPEPERAGMGVFASEPTRRRVDPLAQPGDEPQALLLEPSLPFDRKGHTFLEAITLGVRDALRTDPRVFVYGEDVGGNYGNAFLLLEPLLDEFRDRILNSPLAESAVLGVCVGAALAGDRPIGEMQFNDFVATGFNQLVNNAAKIRYRWGAAVPMVVRMPWGGLRHAGPYHSQNTEPWFYRTPGLKIVVPSTPHDARALMRSAIDDPDPVLYYEHIALYRDPRIKQRLGDEIPQPIPIGKAALRREGGDLAIISYGAYVHVAIRVADRLGAEGIRAAVLDLRSLAPLDRPAVLALARQCHRILIVHEDSRTGGIGESLASIIQEEAFEWLDAPIRIVGALDTPVPYSPPLEEFFLPSEADIEQAARTLVAY